MQKKIDLDSQDKKYKPQEIRQIVLAALGISIVLGGSLLISPHFPILYLTIAKLIEELKGEKVPRHKIKRVLLTLEKKKIIKITQENDAVFVHIKDTSNSIILKHSIKRLLEFKKKKKRWRGKWYLVFFDVPELERVKRNYLRKFLKDLGFYQYQQSVYLFPYECKQEIELIKKIVEGGKYMSYITADKIEHENEARKFFNINYHL